ncbi:bifunctional D-glycero-beta-D-manno-heptose-7-phosphate kinase/D-glycero-beta-D-manno-heptose 1-phosphate adenylyltransferase HldE [Succinimonas amylolytica]|uniref:bifunctional D-glycero-beta-D-manno-heptose-7-phosphate kinase/D-glycero-beta-D-manno-heptose 1-phosphate adenylyltransferase HldE n=1 Tax=Succinimonas amylolytica TaxID=83769 RepID=UPI0023A7A6B4
MSELKLPLFSKASVLVVGDVMVDRYWKGPATRISPEAPVPVVRIVDREDRPGGAANVALNISSLGAGCTLVGCVGNDENGRLLKNRLENSKVRTSFVVSGTLPTITKMRVLSVGQQLLRLDFEKGFQGADQAPILSRVRDEIAGHPVVIFSDYDKGALESVRKMIEIAREAGAKVLIDPKGTDFERYRGAYLITPNTKEFEAVAGHAENEQDLYDKGFKLVNQYDLGALLITRSEKGMTLIRRDAAPLTIPTAAKEVYDVTGAGDTVIATVAACLAAGTSLPEACALANKAAGVVVGKIGTSTVSIEELKNALNEQSSEHIEGLVTKERLLELVGLARAHGEKVVMTNGCFDIIHAGHVAYLKEAKKLGDRLIVAVNTDESVGRLKGPSRPVNTLENRMEVLAALEAVDWVVPFGEDTPRELISEVLPDVLVKGGDYRPEDVAGGAEVIANGGEVRILPFKPGCSTTAIINRIRQTN